MPSKSLKGAFSKELVFALDICQHGGKVAFDYFQQGVRAEMKDDGSPVTKADKEVERIIRGAINATFPDDGILGEEEGESFAEGSASGRRWILDPIDGTHGFARGIPVFSTLLALEEDGEVILGIVHAPGMGETFWAEKGRGAFRNGKRVYVSEVCEISEAMFNFGGPSRILELGLWDAFTETVRKTSRQRGFGDYYGFGLVIDGRSEAMLEVGVKPWDIAPMKILVEEAGGRFVDLKGGNSVHDGSCLITNAALHEEFKRLLRIG